jgi:RNA polymerase sigma-70 factor (ECF subfamily)
MTGSVADGEDVVQETLIRALKIGPDVHDLDAWVFRIAHNAATDLLRRRTRIEQRAVLEEPELPVPPDALLEERRSVAARVGTFLRLPVAQRSAVILMDVLGYSLREIENITSSTQPAIKAALHRGRLRLRELSRELEEAPAVVIDPSERRLYEAYVERFNAQDFDAVRELLAEEVRLDLVSRMHLRGKSDVTTYFHNYERAVDWRFELGVIDGRLALVSHDPRSKTLEATYFVVLRFEDGRLSEIRDFRYARYALDGATVERLPD